MVNTQETIIREMSDEEFNAQKRALGISLHTLTSKIELHPLDSVNPHNEWQPRQKTEPSRLRDAIANEGLAEPIKVFRNAKGPYADGMLHAVNGRTRYAALCDIEANDDDTWKMHGFDKGVPFQVYENLSDAQILALRSDEGRNQAPLVGKVECFNALKPYYDSGCTDKMIEIRAWSIIADTCCTVAKKNELYEAFIQCETSKDFAVAVHNATYGHQQFMRAVYNCPDIVRQAWIDGENGVEGSYKITGPELKKMAQIYKAEIAADVECGPDMKGYNKSKPGPGITTFLQELLAKKAANASGNGDGPKEQPMSKTERQAHVDEGKSKIEKTIFSAVNGSENCKATLPALLNALALYERANDIDSTLLDGVINAVINRGSAVPAKARKSILAAING